MVPNFSASSSSPAASAIPLLLLLCVGTLPAVLCWTEPGDGVLLLKKSDAPQWDDLGWSWGKRSAPAAAAPNWDDLGWAWGKRSAGGAKLRSSRAAEALNANRVLRSMAKQNPDWHDLGWAWGRRK